MKHIIRFEYGRSRGWWVRVERSGFVRRKLFSDSNFGGKKRAMLAAQKYRDSTNWSIEKSDAQVGKVLLS